jgi:hypothetical protein
LGAAFEEGALADVMERRSEPRYDCNGFKTIIQQKRVLSVVHLRDISSWGACGMTDMPVAVGALVFFELKKGHFYGARVKWVNRFTIGVQFVRQIRPEILKRVITVSREQREAKLRAFH